ncbi:MAG: acetyl-CoA C-acyltransferase [Planctomycetota bacterium]
MSKRRPIAVIDGARTPMAKAFTSLMDQSAVSLGVRAIEGLLEKTKRRHNDFGIDHVDEVVMGNVSGPPDAANVARVIALKAGVPMDRVAHTVNRNCASGMESILSTWDSIAQGRSKLAIAGGSESMSQVPLLWNSEAAVLWTRVARARSMWQKTKTLAKFRPRHFKPVIGLELGLTDPVSGLNMGETAEVLAKDFSISRQEQDHFATESHRKASAAQKRCFLSGEIAPIRSGESEIKLDNVPRHEQSVEQLARLNAIFKRDGTVTAGNSCPLTDGAAALLMSDIETAKEFDQPLGYITDVAVSGCDPSRMGLGPVYATAKLLRQTGYSLNDFAKIEINEAFAAQVIACLRAASSRKFAQDELGLSKPLGEFKLERLNVHGGAIGLGHPVGMTGTRLVLTLLRTLRESGGDMGLATLCVGGGQGVAMIVRTRLENQS